MRRSRISFMQFLKVQWSVVHLYGFNERSSEGRCAFLFAILQSAIQNQRHSQRKIMLISTMSMLPTWNSWELPLRCNTLSRSFLPTWKNFAWNFMPLKVHCADWCFRLCTLEILWIFLNLIYPNLCRTRQKRIVQCTSNQLSWHIWKRSPWIWWCSWCGCWFV